MINTHKQSDTNYTLRLASIKPHFQPIHALWRCIPVAEECNQNTQSHEPDRKWLAVDWARPRVCSWSCWWRIQAGWLVEVWCSGSLFAHIYSLLYSKGIFSKIWNPVFWEMHILLQSDWWETGRSSFKARHTIKKISITSRDQNHNKPLLFELSVDSKRHKRSYYTT